MADNNTPHPIKWFNGTEYVELPPVCGTATGQSLNSWLDLALNIKHLRQLHHRQQMHIAFKNEKSKP